MSKTDVLLFRHMYVASGVGTVTHYPMPGLACPLACYGRIHVGSPSKGTCEFVEEPNSTKVVASIHTND